MYVSVDYSDAIRKAYQRGASDTMMYMLDKKRPKPDVERYMEQLSKRPTVARL